MVGLGGGYIWRDRGVVGECVGEVEFFHHSHKAFWNLHFPSQNVEGCVVVDDC